MKKRTKVIIFGYLTFIAVIVVAALTTKPSPNVDRSTDYDDYELAELVKTYGEDAVLKGE